jgi:predicted dehydrogenase
MASQPVGIGIIGSGNISAAYLRTVGAFPLLRCVACADLDIERARARAEEFGAPTACLPDELLANDAVEIVVNLTTPQAHASVALAAIAAGKHVFNEKPLTVTRSEARQVLEAAEAKNVRVGCAPGTFLGAGLQTCRKLIDDGAIGAPLVATAYMMGHGHESWHPDPEFYYMAGGGPMMDMGPYYLTALIQMLGPIRRVSGSAGILIPERTIGSEKKRGQKIAVETPDHVAGTIDFAGGAIGTIITSFAVWHAQNFSPITIFGTEGTLAVPDPNSLGGTVRLRRAQDKEWAEVPYTHSHGDRGQKWGIGVADLAYAVRSGRAHRASGAQAFHVLDAMHGFLDAAESGRAYEIEATFSRPAPLPTGLPEDALDD